MSCRLDDTFDLPCTFNLQCSSNVFLVMNLLTFLDVVRWVRLKFHTHQSNTLNRVSSKSRIFLACKPHFCRSTSWIIIPASIALLKLFNVYYAIRCNFSMDVPPLFTCPAHRLNWPTHVTFLNRCWTALNSRLLFFIPFSKTPLLFIYNRNQHFHHLSYKQRHLI